MGIVAADRVFEIIDRDDLIQEEGKLAAPVFKGAIEFKDVDFSYGNGKKVLHGINLSIQPGQTVAIVGSSGAGKSTIDRKSTRLNSSHVRISYAVFCLKKKKETRIN